MCNDVLKTNFACIRKWSYPSVNDTEKYDRNTEPGIPLKYGDIRSRRPYLAVYGRKRAWAFDLGCCRPRPKADDRIRPCTFTYDEKRQSYISVVNCHRARRDTNDYVCRIRRYQRRSCTASVHGRIRSCCHPCTISYDTAYCDSPRTAKKISPEICLIILCIVCILSLSYPYDCSPIS